MPNRSAPAAAIRARASSSPHGRASSRSSSIMLRLYTARMASRIRAGAARASRTSHPIRRARPSAASAREGESITTVRTLPVRIRGRIRFAKAQSGATKAAAAGSMASGSGKT